MSQRHAPPGVPDGPVKRHKCMLTQHSHIRPDSLYRSDVRDADTSMRSRQTVSRGAQSRRATLDAVPRYGTVRESTRLQTSTPTFRSHSLRRTWSEHPTSERIVEDIMRLPATIDQIIAHKGCLVAGARCRCATFTRRAAAARSARAGPVLYRYRVSG